MQPAQTTHYLTEKSAFTFAIHAKQHAKKSSDHFHKRVKKNTTQKKKIRSLFNESTKWITMQGNFPLLQAFWKSDIAMNTVERTLILQHINNYYST